MKRRRVVRFVVAATALSLGVVSCSTPHGGIASAGVRASAPRAPLAARGAAPTLPPSHELPAGCGPAGRKFRCNPVTNAGCNQAEGEACDYDEKGGFACYPGPNEVAEGGACNDKEGPSCAAGLACDNLTESDPNGTCQRLCCAKTDCPKAQACDVIDPKFGKLGFCR